MDGVEQTQTPDGADSLQSPQFTFVFDKGQKGLRNHAMREYWKKRHKTKQKQKQKQEKAAQHAPRPLLPNTGSASSSASPPTPSPPSIENHDVAHLVSSQQQRLAQLQLDAADQLATDRATQSQSRGNEPALPGIPTQTLTGLNHALAHVRLDPFDTFPVKLTAQHHKLLHHWLSTHATMMFEELPITTFNPMRDVWFPLDLSNEASFNAVMAHSAAHLARLQGIKVSSEALSYKAQAVHIVMAWMNDPARALSDEVFAAVLRLLTYERYWGTEAEWRVHRNGLQDMIEARGGIAALQSNWRLELVAFLVSLMSKPSWFDASNHIWEICEQPLAADLHPIMGNVRNLHRVRCLWLISFIQDMRTLMGGSSELYLDGLACYTAVQDAALLLQADSHHHTSASLHEDSCTPAEFARLACLFFISVLLQGSMSTHDSTLPPAQPGLTDLALLDIFLYESRPFWEGSVENLHAALFHHFPGLSDAPQKRKYVLHMTNVLGCMSGEARRGVEKCLLHMLCRAKGSELRFAADDSWTPDALLSASHGE